MVQINFNATQYDPSASATDVFENGDYTFHIVESETKATKSGNGTMLVFTAECLDPEHARKRTMIRLNIVNPNPTTVEIAFRQLSAICHVCGVLQVQDTQQLHGKPFKLRLEKKPRSDDPSKFNNEIKAFMDVNGNEPGKSAQGGAPAPGAPQAPAAPQQPAAPAAPAPTPAPAAAPAPAPAPAAQQAPEPAPQQPWGQQPAAPAPAAEQPAPAPAAEAPAAPATEAPAAPWQQAGATAPAPAAGAPTPPWGQPG